VAEVPAKVKEEPKSATIKKGKVESKYIKTEEIK
jgi:hypothetical protein